VLIADDSASMRLSVRFLLQKWSAALLLLLLVSSIPLSSPPLQERKIALLRPTASAKPNWIYQRFSFYKRPDKSGIWNISSSDRAKLQIH